MLQFRIYVLCQYDVHGQLCWELQDLLRASSWNNLWHSMYEEPLKGTGLGFGAVCGILMWVMLRIMTLLTMCGISNFSPSGMSEIISELNHYVLALNTWNLKHSASAASRTITFSFPVLPGWFVFCASVWTALSEDKISLIFNYFTFTWKKIWRHNSIKQAKHGYVASGWLVVSYDYCNMFDEFYGFSAMREETKMIKKLFRLLFALA